MALEPLTRFVMLVSSHSWPSRYGAVLCRVTLGPVCPESGGTPDGDGTDTLANQFTMHEFEGSE
jgi:hypothetical protein